MKALSKQPRGGKRAACCSSCSSSSSASAAATLIVVSFFVYAVYTLTSSSSSSLLSFSQSSPAADHRSVLKHVRPYEKDSSQNQVDEKQQERREQKQMKEEDRENDNQPRLQVQDDEIRDIDWDLCNVTAGPDYIPCLDNVKAIKKLKSLKHYEHRERHCPEESPACLVPLPKGYKRSIQWPLSRDKVVVIVNCVTMHTILMNLQLLNFEGLFGNGFNFEGLCLGSPASFRPCCHRAAAVNVETKRRRKNGEVPCFPRHPASPALPLQHDSSPRRAR